MRALDLETPAVLIDLERVEANLKRTQDYADAHGVRLRPHIKTHKLPRFAKRQLELGAIGITVQKLGEAEVMADAGISDIFLPYNIIGASKLKRLRALTQRITIRVTADSSQVVDGLSQAFADADKPLDVLIECDTGGSRCGVQTPEAALELAQHIDKAAGLSFAGLMTYPAAGGYAEAAQWLATAKTLIEDAGLPLRIISNGGTPDLWNAHANTVATEHRPGTYIYLDRMQVNFGMGTLEDCALTVLATVVSRPTETRAVIDAGSKALSSDAPGLGGYGYIIGYPEAEISTLSEEHGVIDLTKCDTKPAIGDVLRIIPNHACVVSNLFNEVNLVSGDQVVETVPVAARGKLT
ncbi:alanine racemase [Devosia pacifica]|uniref:Alanine racemase n=1 Tax=Devosia pacifica TaxID=1335967 RepID=A0A918S753_9HYPH|nr:D-TA family PLP-dependent enzyme [Devosia pacifica]GHA24302.1 alanine racemase [Devosia pacifica]